MREIHPDDFTVSISELLLQRWMLLTAGDFSSGKYNCMTVGWGFLGSMWNRPCFIAAVRPNRYTHDFLGEYESFTLTAFPREFRKDLSHLGAWTGRDGDKLSRTGLHAVAASRVAAPSFQEADICIECRKIYLEAIRPEGIIDEKLIAGFYDGEPYHSMIYGEVITVQVAE